MSAPASSSSSTWFSLRRSKRRLSSTGLDDNKDKVVMKITTQFNTTTSIDSKNATPTTKKSFAEKFLPSLARRRSLSMGLFSPSVQKSNAIPTVDTKEDDSQHTSNMTAEQFARAIGLPVLAFTDEQDDMLARTDTIDSIHSLNQLTLSRHFTDMSLDEFTSMPPATAPAQPLHNLVMKSPPMLSRPTEPTINECDISDLSFSGYASGRPSNGGPSSAYLSPLFSPCQLPADIIKQRISPPKLDMSLFIPPTPESTPPPSEFSESLEHTSSVSSVDSLFGGRCGQPHQRAMSAPTITIGPSCMTPAPYSSPFGSPPMSVAELPTTGAFSQYATSFPRSSNAYHSPHSSISSFHKSTLGPIAGSPSVDENGSPSADLGYDATTSSRTTHLLLPSAGVSRRSHRRTVSEGSEYFRRKSTTLEKLNEEFVKVEKRGRFTVTREVSSHWRPRNRTQSNYTRFQPVLDDPKPLGGLVVTPSPIMTSPTARYLHMLQSDQCPAVANTPFPLDPELFSANIEQHMVDLPVWDKVAYRQNTVDSGVSDMS